MGVKTSVYFDDETSAKLEEMAKEERRSVSNFLSLLIAEEYERRNMPTSIAEAARRLPEGG